MIIEENEVLAEKYQKALLEANIFYRSPFIHRSDLIYCLRKAFFRIKGIEKPKPSKFMPLAVIGRVLHVLMEEVYERREVVKSKFGFTSTIDMLKDGKPVEIKTTRATVTVKKLHDVFKTWREQLETAMLFTDQNVGHLFVLNVVSGKLSVYDFSFESEGEAMTFEKELLNRKRLLEYALELNNYRVLPLPECWQCNFCEYECEKEVVATKVCLWCKGLFVPKVSWQKYCCVSCRNKRWGKGNGKKVWSKEMFARATVVVEG